MKLVSGCKKVRKEDVGNGDEDGDTVKIVRCYCKKWGKDGVLKWR